MDSFYNRLVNSPLPACGARRRRIAAAVLVTGVVAATGLQAAEPWTDQAERAVVLRKLAEDAAPPDRAPVQLPPAQFEPAPREIGERLGDPGRLERIRRELDAAGRERALSLDEAAGRQAHEARQLQDFQDRAWRRELESQAADKHRPGALPGAAQSRQQIFDRERDARDLSIRMQRRN